MRRILLETRILAVALGITFCCGFTAWAGKPKIGGGGNSPSYQIVKLDDAGGLFVASPSGAANDINTQGNVIGTVADPWTGKNVPAFWYVIGTSSVLIPLADSGVAEGINDSNEIVGHATVSSSPLVHTGLYWSSPTAAPVALPPLEEGLATVATAINNSSVICGWARKRIFDELGEPAGTTDVAVVWRILYLEDGAMQIAGPVSLPTLDDGSQAYDLNDNDNDDGIANVVGTFMTSGFGQTAAVQWTVQSSLDGSLSVDPTFFILENGNASAFAVNNHGVRCGDSDLEVLGPLPRVWSSGSNATLKSGDLLHATASDISDAGVVVGSGGAINLNDHDAVVWSTLTADPILLNKFLPRRNSPFAYLETATAVNATGTVVGIGANGSDRYGFLAIPK